MAEEEIVQDENLFDLSDEELEARVSAAKAEDSEPEAEVDAEPEDVEVDDVDDDEISDEQELEEPEEESEDDDNDDSDDEEPVEEDDEEDSDADENEEAEEQPDEAKAPEEVKKYTYKANGQEFEFTEDEIKEQFGKVFAQSMNYTQKMQAIAPYRKMISAMEEEGLTQDDMNLMIDVLKGNKDAIATVLKRADVDVLDLDIDGVKGYSPNEYGRDDTELAIKEIVDEISRDPEYETTHQVIGQRWDDRSREAFVDKPELIKALHVDVKTGVFDKVSPIAAKLKVYDGGRRSDIEYYIEAGKQYYASVESQQQRQAELEALEAEKAEAERLAKVKAEADKRAATKQASRKRRAAAPTKSRAGQKVTSYLDDSDEAFEEWYKKLQEKM